MFMTLRAKLIVATLGSVATIAILVFAINYGSGTLAGKLRQTQLAAIALRNHTNADMMHDAIRADVFAAFLFSLSARQRRDEIMVDVHRHGVDLKKYIADNDTLDLTPDIKETLKRLHQPLDAYISSAEGLVSRAFEGEPDSKIQLNEFEQDFSNLEVLMRTAGDEIEALANRQGESASTFATQAQWLSEAGLVLSLVIGSLLIWVTQFNVLSPLSSLTDALRRLANGEHQAALPTLRRDEIGQMARTIESFGKNALERERLSRETRVLSELNEWLQSAKSEPELYDMIAKFLSHFLPECTGTIYIYANSRDILECVKVWNGKQATLNMHPDDCWGLRRGRTYTHGQHEIEFDCFHVVEGPADYCCIPILAHGETVGLLHLEHKPQSSGDNSAAFADQRRLGLAAVEHISLAIANVKLRDQLRDQSIRDVLTGLFNRRYLLETGRREFQRAARNRQPVSMLSIDVDHFKTFNDNHGHDAGDTVLRAVGEALSSTFRGDDICCRFCGEEFVALLPGSPIDVAAERAEELRAKVEGLVIRYGDDNLPQITISVGVASFPSAGTGPMEVLKVADIALYRAKELGRNRVEMPSGYTSVASAGAFSDTRPEFEHSAV